MSFDSHGKAGSEITESVSEDIDEANATQYAGIKGGSGRNHLENATTFEGNAPMFVAPASANFRLRLGSPALNTATNVDLSWANSSQDVYDNAASKASARDVGAME